MQALGSGGRPGRRSFSHRGPFRSSPSPQFQGHRKKKKKALLAVKIPLVSVKKERGERKTPEAVSFVLLMAGQSGEEKKGFNLADRKKRWWP